MSSEEFAFVRATKIATYGDLKRAETHANGLDQSASRRRVHEGYRAMALTLGADGKRKAKLATVGANQPILEAFSNLKKLTGASQRKNAALAVHLIVGVSPSALKDPEGREPNDPRHEGANALLAQAVQWAEEEFGPGSVFAARRDLDESGACVADILVAPVRMMRSGRGKPKPRISTAKALREIAERYGRPESLSYSALNDGWAKYAQAHIDPNLKRGREKSETGREHIDADIYWREAQANRADVLARIERDKAELEETETALKAAHAQKRKVEEAAKRIATDLMEVVTKSVRVLLGKLSAG